MAHLRTSGVWKLEDLDLSHPVIATATMGEIDRAMREAFTLVRPAAREKLERWMGGEESLNLGSGLTMTPFEEARFHHLKYRVLRDGHSCLVHSPFEVFQVCHAYNSNCALYHVQPLLAPKTAAYFLRTSATTSMLDEFPGALRTRSPFGSMGSLIREAVRAKRSPLPQDQQPLHDYIIRALNFSRFRSMQHPRKIAIIGAGGTGCVLAPLLCRNANLVICDEDAYEPKNHGRQVPSLLSTENKAKVLAGMVRPQTLYQVDWIDAYLKDVMISSRPQWQGVDFIFGAVDNNKSRAIIADVATELGIPAILAGNEHAHGEAHLVLPGVYEPFSHFEFPDNEPAPWSCNSDKALEEHPQTFAANVMAAGAAMHLLLSYTSAKNPLNGLAYSRLDVFSSTTSRVKDLLASPATA